MEEIRQFIETHCGFEKTEILCRIISGVDELGKVTPSVAIGNIINDGANMDSMMIQDQIHEIAEDALDNLFKDMEFVVEGSLLDKLTILEGIAMLEKSIASQEIVDIIDGEDDPKEVWMQLLALMNNVDEDKYFANLISVPERSLETLYKIHEVIVAKQEMLSQPRVKELTSAQQERLTRFVTARPMSLLTTALNESYRVGTSKKEVLDRFNSELLQLAPNAPKDAAYELIGLGLLMDLPEKGFITALRDMVRDLYDDSRYNASAIFELDRITMELKLYG